VWGFYQAVAARVGPSGIHLGLLSCYTGQGSFVQRCAEHLSRLAHHRRVSVGAYRDNFQVGINQCPGGGSEQILSWRNQVVDHEGHVLAEATGAGGETVIPPYQVQAQVPREDDLGGLNEGSTGDPLQGLPEEELRSS
jgi:hypothetical protein